MKRIGIFLLTGMALGLFSCSTTDGDGTIFMRSYVYGYIDGPLTVEMNNAYKKRLELQLVRGAEDKLWERGSGRYEELCARNGDLTYNRKVGDGVFSDFRRWCCVQNYRFIDVVCTNAAWDAEHPAGSSLRDVVEADYFSAMRYVRSGYDENVPLQYTKKLTECTEDDLSMLLGFENYMYLDFLALPAESGTYEMQVTLTTVDGEEKQASCTMEWVRPEDREE